MASTRAILLLALVALFAPGLQGQSSSSSDASQCTKFWAFDASADAAVSAAFGTHALYLFDTSLTNGVQQFVWASNGNFEINGSSAILSGRMVPSGAGNKNDGFDVYVTFAAGTEMYMGMNELLATVQVDMHSWRYWTVQQPSYMAGFGSFASLRFQLEQQTADMPMQIGAGANGKNIHFGAAVWLNILGPNGQKIASDINIDLNCTDICPGSNSFIASAASADAFAKFTGGAAFSFFDAPAQLGNIQAWIFADNSGLVRINNGDLHLSGVIIPAPFAATTPATTNLRFTINLLFHAAPADFTAMPHLELIDSAYQVNGGQINPDTWSHYFIDSAASSITDGNGVTIALTTQMGMPLQMGWGANGKNIHLGASAWFDYTLGTFSGSMDINIDLTCPFEESSSASASSDSSSVSSASSSSSDDGCSVSVAINQANTWVENGRTTRLVYVTLTNTGSHAVTDVNLTLDDKKDDCSSFAPSCIRQFWSMAGCDGASDPAQCTFTLPDWLTLWGGLRVGAVHNWGFITYSPVTDIKVVASCTPRE